MKAIAVAVVVVSLASVASAESLRSQITAADKSYERIMMKKDMDAFDKLMRPSITSDFIYQEMGQTMTYDKMFAQMKMGMGAMTKMKSVVSKLLTLKESGDKATATTLRSMSGFTAGPDKKDHLLSFSGTTTDTYVKQAGKWKFAKMVWGKETMSMDGKVIDPSKMGGPGQ